MNSEPLTVEKLSEMLLTLIKEGKGHYTVEVDAIELHSLQVDDDYRYIDLLNLTGQTE